MIYCNRLKFTLIATLCTALVACGSSDNENPPTNAGAGAGDDGAASGGDESAAGSASDANPATDIDELCATDCAIGSSTSATLSCQSGDCQSKCVARYNDAGVAAVAGCQAAYLAVLQCGSTAPAIAWSCYNGNPFPLGSQDCLPLGLKVASDDACSMALRNASNTN